ncbi:MAG: 2-oxoacid:acceptor oxidoreductase family protein [Acidimicrobiia bacterium]
MTLFQIRIAGEGGQGLVTAGRILAEAAILAGYNATQNQVYGPQSRGGASRSDVIISSEEIGFPLTQELDFLLLLSSEAYRRYLPGAGPQCRIIADRGIETDNRPEDVTWMPLVDTARTHTGGQLAAGVVAIGVLQPLLGGIDADSLRRALMARIPERHRTANLEALEAGVKLCRGVAV